MLGARYSYESDIMSSFWRKEQDYMLQWNEPKLRRLASNEPDAVRSLSSSRSPALAASRSLPALGSLLRPPADERTDAAADDANSRSPGARRRAPADAAALSPILSTVRTSRLRPLDPTPDPILGLSSWAEKREDSRDWRTYGRMPVHPPRAGLGGYAEPDQRVLDEIMRKRCQIRGRGGPGSRLIDHVESKWTVLYAA